MILFSQDALSSILSAVRSAYTKYSSIAESTEGEQEGWKKS